MKLLVYLLILINFLFIVNGIEIYTKFKIKGEGCNENGNIISIDQCSSECGVNEFIDYLRYNEAYNFGVGYKTNECLYTDTYVPFECSDTPATVAGYEIECLDLQHSKDFKSFTIQDNDAKCSVDVNIDTCTFSKSCNYYYQMKDSNSTFNGYVINVYSPPEDSSAAKCNNDDRYFVYSVVFTSPEQVVNINSDYTITCHNDFINSTSSSNSSSDSKSSSISHDSSSSTSISEDNSTSSIIKYSFNLILSFILFFILI